MKKSFFSRIFIWLFFIGIIFFSFLPSLKGDYLNWDDTFYLRDNHILNSNFNLNNVRELYEFDKHISITLLSFKLQYVIFGKDVLWSHFINVLIHVFNALLIYFLSKKLGLSKNISFCVALVFAIHPSKAESVNWIIQRKDLLFTFFYLLAIQVYIKILFNKKKLLNVILLFILSFLSVHSKIHSLTLPLVLILITILYSKFNYKLLIFNILLLFFMLNSLEKIFINFILAFFAITMVYDTKIENKNNFEFSSDSFNKIISCLLNLMFLITVIIIYLNLISLFDNIGSFNWIFDTLFLLLYLLFLFKLLKKTDFIPNLYRIKFLVKIIFFSIFLLCFLIFVHYFKLNSYIILSISHFILYLSFITLFFILIVLANNNQTAGFKLVYSIFNFVFKNKLKTIYLLLLSALVMPNLFKLIIFDSHDIFNNLLIIYFLYIMVIILLFLEYSNKFSIKWVFGAKIVALMLILFSFIVLFLSIYFIKYYYNNCTELSKIIFYFSYSIIYYLLRIFYVFNLNPMVPYPDKELPDIMIISPFILFLVIISLFVFIPKLKGSILKRQIVFGLLFFFFNVLIVSHIFPIGGKVIVADRYSYLASYGIIFGLASIIDKQQKLFTFKKNQLLYFIFIPILLLLSITTYSYSKIWKNDYSFWSYVIKRDAYNHYAIYSMGLYYYQKNDFTKALENYNKAIQMYPYNAEYYLNRGSCLYRLNIFDNAEADFEKVLELNPNDIFVYKNRGILFFETGEFQKAYEDFKKFLKYYPDDKVINELKLKCEILFNEIKIFNDTGKTSNLLSKYYSEVGIKYVNAKKFEKSLKYMLDAIAYDSLNLAAYKNLGNIYAITGKLYDAKIIFEYLINLDSNDAGSYLNLGNVFHQLGDNTKACEIWEKAYMLGDMNALIMLNKFCK